MSTPTDIMKPSYNKKKMPTKKVNLLSSNTHMSKQRNKKYLNTDRVTSVACNLLFYFIVIIRNACEAQKTLSVFYYMVHDFFSCCKSSKEQKKCRKNRKIKLKKINIPLYTNLHSTHIHTLIQQKLTKWNENKIMTNFFEIKILVKDQNFIGSWIFELFIFRIFFFMVYLWSKVPCFVTMFTQSKLSWSDV